MEEITYTNPICSQVPGCYSSYGKYSIGFRETFNEQEKDNNLKYFCWKMTNNQESKVINFTLGEDKKQISFLLWNARKNAPDFGMSTMRENYYTSITCAVPKPQILGCTNPEATNYNSQATEDDGSCTLPPPPPPKIPGCTNPQALNYNPDATEDNGTCIEKIEGCTDSTATNYNPRANIHVENMCQYPPEGPSEITGFFEKSPTVQIGATTWTITLKTNIENALLDISQVQVWEHFRVTEYTTESKEIIITMKQFDDQRLKLEECTNYEITIPRDAITAQVQKRTGTEIIKNHNAITGNFTVAGCNGTFPTNGSGSIDVNIGSGTLDVTPKPQYENTIKESNFYLSLYDTDEKGKVYINLTNMIYILGFISFFLVLFFVLFGFIKNSFLGKSKR